MNVICGLSNISNKKTIIIYELKQAWYILRGMSFTPYDRMRLMKYEGMTG